ncbi:hypothetical protein E0485_00500 [Paenibacillus albiflavus]|uniref:Glycosyl transferase n=1 Tax=Paenibacillus albiflavus TaxID=2545760 RepID=A0A4R4ELC9_9BACL|nr:hypothetical protein [Paenibacillus albiflavus]TCZ80809.1 hypothetical protein E0485_00500 [Paenibacillus albiflavus]
MIIGTVVTNSHIARAKVLAQSIKMHHPEFKVVVSLVERSLNPEFAEFPFFDEVILCKDTWKGNFDQMIFKYEAWEACCFAKAPLLNYIFNKYKEENHVLFLDSDMQVLAPLDDLSGRFNRSSILLTPQHIYKGNEYDNFKYGVYNAGLIGVSRSSEGQNFINWWSKRLERHAYFAEYDTLFAEQKWLNLVSAFFNDVEVIKHPGYNIAGWNFNERQISRRENGQIVVNGEPLYILHHHGINEMENNVKSEDFVKDHQVLSELTTEYVKQLNDMGRHRFSSIPWGYQFFTNGTSILRASRLIYRNNLKLEKEHPNPFHLNNEFFGQYQEKPENIEQPRKRRITKRRRIRWSKRRRKVLMKKKFKRLFRMRRKIAIRKRQLALVLKGRSKVTSRQFKVALNKRRRLRRHLRRRLRIVILVKVIIKLGKKTRTRHFHLKRSRTI